MIIVTIITTDRRVYYYITITLLIYYDYATTIIILYLTTDRRARRSRLRRRPRHSLWRWVVTCCLFRIKENNKKRTKEKNTKEKKKQDVSHEAPDATPGRTSPPMPFVRTCLARNTWFDTMSHFAAAGCRENAQSGRLNAVCSICSVIRVCSIFHEQFSTRMRRVEGRRDWRIVGIFRSPLLGEPSLYAYVSWFSLMYISILLNKATLGYVSL